jgi:hypothetical protein
VSSQVQSFYLVAIGFVLALLLVLATTHLVLEAGRQDAALRASTGCTRDQVLTVEPLDLGSGTGPGRTIPGARRT